MKPLTRKQAAVLAVTDTQWKNTGDIARASHESTPTSLKALLKLERLGIVKRKRGSYEYGGKRFLTFLWRTKGDVDGSPSMDNS